MSDRRGESTWQEITAQPAAWAQALDVVCSRSDHLAALWSQHPGQRVIFTGCGSTYYLSVAAASLFQTLTARGARAVPAGELILYPAMSYEVGAPTVLVAISRSGTTSETVKAVEEFKTLGNGAVIAISTYENTPLTAHADVALVIPGAQEYSVAQTRSFTSMYVATVAVAAHVSGKANLLTAMEALPEFGERLIDSGQSFARSLGENLDLDRFYFLGSGPRYGLACESNLKMKEMSLTHSEPFPFLEFRHGPMSMVTDSTAIIGLRAAKNYAHEQAVLDDMRDLGGHVYSLSDGDADINFSCQLPDPVQNVLYLPVLQMMAHYRSMAKGLNPDKPNNLSAVINLNLARETL